MKAAQLLVLQALLLSVAVAHRHHHHHQQLLSQYEDGMPEMQLIVSDFSSDQKAKPTPQPLAQLTKKVDIPIAPKQSMAETLSTDDQDFDHISNTNYGFEELEAFTDAAIDGKPKNHDLFYYGMHPPAGRTESKAKEPAMSTNTTMDKKPNVTEHQSEKAKWKAATRAQAIKDAEDEDEYDTHINFDNIDNTVF